jgi:uncharacterized protein YabN with tetrapyrrole methylase and pyrophosphatase domain
MDFEINKMMTTIQQAIKIEIEGKEFGFYWSHYSQITQNIVEEVQEIQECLENNFSRTHLQEELGDLIFAILSLCFFLNFNPEEIYKNISYKTDYSWPNYSTIINRIIDKTNLIVNYLGQNPLSNLLQSELSNILFFAFSFCTYLHFDPEETLAKANSKIGTRLSNTITNAKKAGFDSLKGEKDEIKMKFWKQAKATEKV